MEDASKKLQGTIWIDEADRQVAHMEVSFNDNFRVAGGIFATIQKGSNFHFDQAPVGGRRLRGVGDFAERQPQPRGAEIGTFPGRVALCDRPARCFYKQQRQWAGRVAIHSTWRGDLYAILRTDDDPQQIGLTLVENPLMRWLWLGGWLAGAGALIALWPARPPSFLFANTPIH